MIKNISSNVMLILGIIITGLLALEGIFGIRTYAEGWVYIDNSWHYYSDSSTKTGWYNENGIWYYLDDEGMKKTGWLKSEGKWYYLDKSTGKMVTGWIQDRGNWYYLNSSGEMITGWLEYNGNLYYLNTSGIMVRDIYIGSYYLGPDGSWKEENCHKK